MNKTKYPILGRVFFRRAAMAVAMVAIGFASTKILILAPLTGYAEDVAERSICRLSWQETSIELIQANDPVCAKHLALD